MKINHKIILMSLSIIIVMTSILGISIYYSLVQYSDNEIDEVTETRLHILETEYEYRFKDMDQLAHVLSKSRVFTDAFLQVDHDEIDTLLEEVVENGDLDFAMLIEPNRTVFYRTGSSMSGDPAPFQRILENVMFGESIATTELVTYHLFGREYIEKSIPRDDSSDVMVQLIFTPIYNDNNTIAYALALGRIVNGNNEIPDVIDNKIFRDTTTIIYQNSYAVATSSSPEKNTLIGTTLDPKIIIDLHTHTNLSGKIERFSNTHIYAASPIKNYDGHVIGTLMISSLEAPHVESIKSAITSMIYAILAGLIFSIFIITLGSRSITKPLKRLDEAAKYVSSMSGYRTVEITTDDEVADVSRSFNMLVDSLREIDKATQTHTNELVILNSALEKNSIDLQKKQEHEFAYSDILTSISKTMDLNTILSDGLNNLMKYTKSPIGVFYLYDSNNQILLPAVTRGTTSDVFERKYALGEGIPGKTALKRDVVVIDDVPLDTVYEIDTGVYNARPSTIVSTPMTFEDKLIGVMITCHLGDVSEDMVNFIKRVVNQYAIAVTNANIYMETQYMAGELKKQRDELDAKSKELIIVSKTKSEFLANMSHELRTPLNSIIGFSEILHDETFGPTNEKQSKYIKNIMTSGKHLLQLINNILDLSKIEAGKMDLNYEIFSVADSINEIITLTSSLASKKGIGVSTAFEPELPPINADIGKFKQILLNLISNSIKFTPDGGTLSIKTHHAENMAQVSITDTGIGLSKEDQDKIFQAFTQADASTSRQYGGTGLGLSLVKQFVNLHGGRIWIDSELGKGSTFTFTIPIDKTIKDPEAESIENSKVPSATKGMIAEKESVTAEKLNTREIDVDSGNFSALKEDIANVEIPAIIESKNAVGDEPLILVIEDDKRASEILIHILIEAGYRVVPAYAGIEALAIAQKLKPLIITLDIMLPSMDGWEVLRYLKDDSETNDIPVIIISMVDEKEIGFVLGAVDYFIKPVQKDVLINSLNNLRESLHIKKPCILIIDDDVDAVELMSLMLEPTGYKIVRAYGGQEGINKAVSEKPDALILDMMMPDVNGFEVVAQLKKYPETKDIPIIICTAKDPDKDMKHLTDDVFHIIQKGTVNGEELIDTIKKSMMLRRNQ